MAELVEGARLEIV